MINRKRWTIQEENELKTLIEANTNVEEIAVKLKKTPGAVILKSQRLGLQLQVKGFIDTSISLPRELPSLQEATKIMAGAMSGIVKPGLNRLEILRLQTAANISKAYKELAIDLAHYRDIELKLKEMAEQNAQLKQMLKELIDRSPGSSSQPVSK